MIDLPQTVIDGLRAYYEHRKAHNDSWARKDDPCIPWDKSSDTLAIMTAASDEMWQTERLAGTFWFKKQVGNSTMTIVMNEGDMPHGKKTVREGNDMDSEVMMMLDKAFKNKGRGQIPVIIDSNDPNSEAKITYDLAHADVSLEERKKMEMAKGIAKMLRGEINVDERNISDR